ncbi:MAG TPA: Yip1 family protein [Bacteroidota bacterium]|nr:Yip1 family protein [Bacteroidota bacterium]
MISCSVCAHPNDDLETICSSCGSFLQDRIPNLDFFSTTWLLVESPRDAFNKIIRAEHKNYVLLLMFFLGIGLSFVLLWARHAGNEFDNLIYLILLGCVLGLVMAFPVGLAMAGVVHSLIKVFGGKGVMKNTYAVIGWSLMPIMATVCIVLPVELASVGLRLFSTNPSPLDVKPVVYLALLAIDGLAVLWSLQLGRVGLSIAHKVSGWRSLQVLCLVWVVFGAALYKLFATLVV